jgi:RNA polymerase sigma factor (sigma-70 family)
MTPDSQLLERFARSRSEDAFAELVRRHVNLVYSAAIRQVNGDTHLAQDVAQTVFSDLARKAPALSRRASLTGWLYTSARFAAAKMLRAEHRRRDREETFMREPIEAAPEPDWKKLHPVLDEVMHQLGETDREAILLRYFEDRAFAEIGARCGLNENAARMRVERALEKLRSLLAKRGVTTTAALASVISINAVQAAPPTLATTLATTSIASAGAGILSFWNIMNMTKLKLGLCAIVVIGASTALTVQHQSREKLLAANESLLQQVAQLKAGNETLSNVAAQAKTSSPLPNEQLNELLRLRSEVGMLRQQTNELARLRSENQKLLPDVLQVESINQLSPEDQFAVHRTHIVNAETTLLRAIRNYAENHNGQYPGSFEELMASGALSTTNFDLEVGGKIKFRSGKWLLITANLDGNLSLDDFEFLKATVVDMKGRRAFLRNRIPIPRPPEDPVWVYGEFSDRGTPMSVITSSDFTKVDPDATQTSTPPNQ